MAEVFTEAWAREACTRLNAREAYRAAGQGWKEPIVLVMAADAAAGLAEDRAVYLDLYDGACRGTRVAGPDDLARAPYVLRADPGTWKRLLAGDAEPVAALMKGQLKLVRGNLFVLAKYTAAAKEMVAAAAEAGGTFPWDAPGR